MISLQRTNAQNIHFIELVKQLDADLAIRDGDEHAFYSQFNTLSTIKHAIVAYREQLAVGCGAFKEYGAGVAEVKRMYTLPAGRREGVAGKILAEIEQWALELGYHTLVLETGTRQPEAIALYTKCGYRQIPNYGQYTGVENSLCFRKELM